jgi:outer membrane protein OmpA-like peptidoglycan-associated protein
VVITPQVEEAQPSTPEELKQAEDIAKDPSQTTETIVLPVDKGAAVLDSDKEVDLSGDAQQRQERQRERQQAEALPPPTSDAEAQAPLVNNNVMPTLPINEQQGERLKERPQFAPPEGAKIWRPDGGQGGNVTNNVTNNNTTVIQQNNVYQDNRNIVQYGDRIVVNSYDTGRIARVGEEPYYERLERGQIRETVVRPDDGMVVTIRNRYGDVIQRSRIDNRGREYVLYYSPQLDREDDERYVYRDPGLDLPPMRLTIPVQDYIIDTTSDPDRDYYDFLERPPVERVERLYSIEEVRHSARIRDKVRRIDLDTITFATGSADISMKEARTLRKVADAISQVLEKDPAETFLIEGHTDAIGSDQANLLLSDRRAESIANILTDVYGIAPENLVTQGYGERYLKVKTLTAEQQNRRVTIRRVTALVRPVAQR